VLGPLLLTVPPRLGSRAPRDLLATLRLAWRHRGLNVRTIADVTRLMTMSIADLLDDWFISPQLKGALAVAKAIESAARSFGAGVRVGARVARVVTSGGHSVRAAGVVLADGTEIRAKVVVTSLHPRTAFPEHVGAEYLPDDFVADIANWKTRSGVVKVNLALAELPDFTANPGTTLAEHHTGSVEIARRWSTSSGRSPTREVRPAARPFTDGVIPTAFDRTLAPEGSPVKLRSAPRCRCTTSRRP